jgi:hypothetical protein
MMTLRRLTAAALIVLIFAFGATAGYLGAPVTTKDGLRVRGWLIATAYSPACRTEVQKQQAFDVFSKTRFELVRVLLPAHAFAHTGVCKVFAHRSQRNLIVNAGEAFLVDAWQNLVELEAMKFHGLGTGVVAAAETDSALGTELTTQYNPDNTRATGSLTEASASVFRSVGTNTFDASAAITEWGLFTQAATGGGTIFSRVVFAAINVASGDSVQTTWDLTVE